WYSIAYGDGQFVAAGRYAFIGNESSMSLGTASTSNFTILAGKNLTLVDSLTVAGDFVNNGGFTNNSTLYLTGTDKTLAATADAEIGNVVISGDIDFLSNIVTGNL